jgi:predicted AlkP superfamily pyrophosphatase or phosphodiesterase
MQKKVYIFMFIDALGWEIVNKYNFMEEKLPHRYPAKMQFGYSCTAIPTILTGQNPQGHKHLSFYYYDEENSPFKIFKLLKFLPSQIFDRWRVRHILSKLIKKAKGYTGYFELYAMPFERLQYFDYIEKTDLFVPGGLAPVANIADELVARDIKYHISNWRLSEKENIASLVDDLQKGEIEFAFLYTAAMDGLLHRVTKDGKEIPEKLDFYEKEIAKVWQMAQEKYADFEFYVISDHGMTTLIDEIDLKKPIEALPYKFGKDYVAVYDSTMARFWFHQPQAKAAICKILEEQPHGKILSDDELQEHGVYFEDAMYGELIYLLDPGYQIAPSDMGINALPGMHGYHPEDKDSIASFLGTAEVKDPPCWVGDYFRVMRQKMDEIVAKRP